MLVALAWPTPGAAVMGWTLHGDVHIVESINIMIVLFISGLNLHAGEAREALGCWRGVAWGLLSTLVLTPLLGYGLRAVPLTPPELTTGLVSMVACPTTFGIGITLVRTARGNVALTTLLTIVTNLAGVFTMGPSLRLLLSAGIDGGPPAGLQAGGVNIAGLLARLSVTVLFPTLAGMACRASPALAYFVDTHEAGLAVVSTTNLGLVIWQSLSVARAPLFAAPWTSVVYLFLLAVGMQIAFYALNVGAVLALRLPPRDAVAVAVAASQKAGLVAVAVVSSIAASPAALGVMCVSIIMCQTIQVFTNHPVALLARRWTKRDPVSGASASRRAALRSAVAAKAVAALDLEAGRSRSGAGDGSGRGGGSWRGGGSAKGGSTPRPDSAMDDEEAQRQDSALPGSLPPRDEPRGSSRGGGASPPPPPPSS